MLGRRSDRDRDAAGRPRNARPRDRYGRPLPHDAPAHLHAPREPEDVVRPPAETLARAQALLDESLPFSAHDVLEAAWKSRPPEERDLWQGLAQLCVGLTHEQRGNPHGAAALLERGADRLREHLRRGRETHGVPVQELVDWAVVAAPEVRAGRALPPPPRLARPTDLPRRTA